MHELLKKKKLLEHAAQFKAVESLHWVQAGVHVWQELMVLLGYVPEGQVDKQELFVKNSPFPQDRQF
jgi:hypothetical protein